MRKTTISKFFLVPLLFSGAVFTNAQNKEGSKFSKRSTEGNRDPRGIERCGTVAYEEGLRKQFPERFTTEQFEEWLAPLIEKNKLNRSQNGNVITIPVVVHVIHNGQDIGTAPNITDSQVMSQITVMNNDFRRMTGTPGFNASLVGADTEIQFVLAKVDPNGNPTNGIDRVNLCREFWANGSPADGYENFINSTVKPTTIWDPTKYMNMWSVNFADSGLLGFAQFPSNSGLPGMAANGGLANTDGVVAGFSTFGSMDYNDGTFLMQAGYDRGRTMTHEVGHFVGLRHIWGDANCGNDYCADTPTAHTANYTCNAAIASCDNASVYEMVQNYMDYTNDTCMNIYTNDQKTRIRTVMDNSPRRVELKTSNRDQPIPLFANDAEIKFDGGCSIGVVNCGEGVVRLILNNRGTSNLTSAVISYSFNGGAVQNYNWTGNLTQDKSSVINIPVDGAVPSSPVSLAIVSVNGTTDERSTNNTSNGNYVKPIIPEYFGTTTFTFKLLRDRYGNETRWNLRNSAGQIVKSGNYSNTQPGQPNPTLITQTWTLPQDCYAFTISDDFGDGLTNGYVDLSTSSGQVVFHKDGEFVYETKTFTTRETLGTKETDKKNNFGIYPNPVNDILTISSVSGEAQFEIHNAVGQLIKKGKIENSQIRVADLVKGTYVITIQDRTISESIKFIKK
ncbi:M43 family zinc metalloprotease [Chryseobacterium sp. WG23]|uniref:M43 family zinc metalloprotease n=1 Tax=Chryseobacterium sp. WG23 TaxID=2926910 RepID=UPI00211ED484|nr:M43 family zinc metalloprotease [Chryseobacterium sp. WG23]MCQ9637039.1 M43 family zinc metalloprotease [Chryseobacterium sp. WG23]